MAKGSCSCGQVKFEYSGEPAATAACHCLACRKSSGNTHSINLIIPDSNLEITSGESTALKKWQRTAESGNQVTNSFCGTCGNTMFVNTPAFDGVTIVKYGLVDDSHVLGETAPQSEIYCKNLLKWESGLPGTERKDHV